jgi:hypothetical protein
MTYTEAKELCKPGSGIYRLSKNRLYIKTRYRALDSQVPEWDQEATDWAVLHMGCDWAKWSVNED